MLYPGGFVVVDIPIATPLDLGASENLDRQIVAFVAVVYPHAQVPTTESKLGASVKLRYSYELDLGEPGASKPPP